MITGEEYPKQFNIHYNEPRFNSFIKFSIYREPGGMSWNGYYKECRLRLWFTGDFWILAGYLAGSEACYFRTTEKICEWEKIEKLVQCACFYIDNFKIKEE